MEKKYKASTSIAKARVKSVRRRKSITDTRVVATSLLVSVSDVLLNLVVSLLTGSVAVLSQSLQGLSDVTTASILYLGVRRAKRQPDNTHPLGYGREIFFWALISAIIMFLGTGAMSVFFGIRQIFNPDGLSNMYLAFFMLSFGLATNLYAFSKSVQLFRSEATQKKWWKGLRDSGMVDTKITFMVDLLGSTAAFLGLVSVVLYLITGDGRFDGFGAVAVGLATMVGASIIISDVHGLIVGRSASPNVRMRVIRAAMNVEGVEDVLDIYVFYIGSNRLFAVLEVHLSEDFTTIHVERISDAIKEKVKKAVPAVHRVQVEVETPDDELIEIN